MLHDSRPPLVETGLAKHGFPPCGCGSLHTPHYAVRREVNHLLFKKPPLVRPGGGVTITSHDCFSCSSNHLNGSHKRGIFSGVGRGPSGAVRTVYHSLTPLVRDILPPSEQTHHAAAPLGSTAGELVFLGIHC